MAEMADDNEVMWSEMAPEELAAALLEEYRRQPGHIELVDGVPWHRLDATNLNTLGNEITGLSINRLREAHRLLTNQGLRRQDGTGWATANYVLPESSMAQNAGNTDMVPHADDTLFDRAVQEIQRLRRQVSQLQQENSELEQGLDRLSAASENLRTVLGE